MAADTLLATGNRRALVYVRSGACFVGRFVFQGDPQDLQDEVAKWRETMPALSELYSTTHQEYVAAPVSIVVPSTFARPAMLRSCIESLLGLAHPEFEVLIVDNRRNPPGSYDDIPLDHRLSVLHEPRPGISAARNRGIAAAKHEIIAFTDDDVSVDSAWLRWLSQPFGNPDVAVVTGLTAPKVLESEAQVWFEEYYGGFGRGYSPHSLRLRQGLEPGLSVEEWNHDGSLGRLLPIHVAAGACGVGANMAIRRSFLERIGGFDISLGAGTASKGGEEVAAFAKALLNGSTIAYEPRAFAMHTHRADYGSLLKQVQGTGTSVGAMLTALSMQSRSFRRSVLRSLPKVLVKTVLSSVRGRSISENQAELTTFPKTLRRREALGLIGGPVGYLSARRFNSRWESPSVEQGGIERLSR